MLINEDTIRARERSAAGQQLSEHISDIIMGHQLVRRSPQGSMAGRAKTSDNVHLGPYVTVRSIPSSSGGRLWKTSDYAGSATHFEAAAETSDFMSGPVRGWRNSSRSPTATATYGSFGRQGLFAAEEIVAMQRGVDVGQGRRGTGMQQQEMGLGLGDFMIQQLQMEQQQQQWPRDPQQSGGERSTAPAAPAPGTADQGDSVADEAAAKSWSAEDSAKKVQQQLFKEAAAGGFRKLLRSMSPKHMWRPSSASGKGAGASGSPSRPSGAAAGGAPGELQWPLLVPAAGSIASSPETSPARSGRSFTATAAAKAAEELGAAAAKRPLTPPGQFSPLKASIVAHTG